MHSVMVDRLEEYLAGALEPVDRRVIEAHLVACRSCRDEIAGLREVSQLLGCLHSDEIVEPAPGFYAGIMRRVDRRRSVPVFGGWFAVDLALGRRLVFASLITLAVLGTYLVSRETGYSGEPSAEAVMAQEYSAAFDSAPAQDRMLVTLTAYER
jgi:predicted anti-sigma-YlaC factor YlaD